MGNTVESQIESRIAKGEVWVGETSFLLTSTNSHKFSINTGASIVVSLGISVLTDATLTNVEVRENENGLAGLELPFYNRNRVVGGNAKSFFTVTDDVTSAGEGDTVSTFTLIGAKGATTPADFTLPLVLKPNTEYVLEVVNNSGGGGGTNYGVLLVLFSGVKGF